MTISWLVLPLVLEGQAGAVPMDVHDLPAEEITLFRALDVVRVLAPVSTRPGIHRPTGHGASDPGLAV